MKDFLLKASKRLSVFIVSIGLFSAHSAMAGGLSGTYTIGSSGTYSSFSAAASALATNGVSGAVTFNVAAGTYTEQVVIGKITGASATNTISFVGQTDSSKVILTYASSSSSTSDYVLELNASRYVTFKKISIIRSGTATYSTDVLLTGGTFHCTFQSCFMMTKFDPSSSVGAGEPCIAITTADTGDVFNGNRVKHGYNCICFEAAGYVNVVSNNIIDSGGMAGLYCLGDYEVDLLVTGNIFNAGTVTLNSTSSSLAYGLRFETSAAKSFTITKNKFYATSTSASTCRCLVIFLAGTDGTNRNLIANNFFWVSAGTSGSTGITLGGGTNIDVVYNNVLMTSTPTTPGSALYIYSSSSYPGSGITLRNNNLIHQGGGYCIDNENDSASTSYTVGLAIEDYNNLYTSGSYTAYYRNTKYTTLANYQAACKVGGAEAHSIAAYPGYKSTSAPYYDLHESSGAVYQAGTPITGVSTDIDGNSRPSTKPCIGACEFTPVYIDAGITAIDSPTTFCYPASKDVVVQFTNFGLNTLTGVIIGWSVNGSVQSPVLWSGSLTSAQTSAQINLGSYTFNSKSPYVLKIWTSQPNSSTDQNKSNDTLTQNVASGLSGTYYLGGTSPDFTSFNGALGAISAYGVCGPTVIRVRNGTYNEQLTVPSFASMSSTNTVTFQSDAGDSSKVILSTATTSTTAVGVYGNNSTIQLNAAKWFIFKQITIQKTGTLTTQNVVQIFNGAHNNSFQNCRFIGVLGATTTNSNTGGDIIWSDSVSTTTETNNTFTNNAFKYGYSAFDLVGQTVSRGTGTVISGNRIDSTYGPAILLTNEDGATVTNNYISNNTAGASYSGIQLTRCNNGNVITGNRIRMPYGAYAGIYMLYCKGTSGTPGTIANNYVSINSTASPRGLFDSTSVYQNFYYNTVDIYGANTGACFYGNAASGNVNVKDNMFANVGGGYDISTPVTTTLVASDYNNQYTSGSNTGLWGTTKCASLSAWQTASSMGAHSVAINPLFNSNTDYHTVNVALLALGNPVSGITTDIEGGPRSATNPAMGCLELRQIQNDAGISSVSYPSAGTICGGPTAINVNLNNYGSKALTSATLAWSVNGTAQTSASFSGSIPSGSSNTVSLGTFNFAGGTAKLKVWTVNPNGVKDSFPYNDTATITYTVNPAPSANAGSNATVCAGNSASIGASSVTGDTYSWASSPADASLTTTSSNPTVTPSSTTSYTLTETITATGCSLSNTVKVTVNALPAAAAGSNSTVCFGNSTSIGATAVTGSTYSWASNPSGYSSTASKASVSPSATTTYTVTETNANNCVASNSVTVTVNALPAAKVGSNASICPGGVDSIGAAAVTGSTYSWSSSPSGFSSTLADPGVSPSATTTYTLTETNANNCVASNSVKVTVNPIPSAYTGNGATICSGNSIKIGGPAVSGNTYAWVSSPSGFTSTVSNPVVTPTVTTTYSLVESVSSGCSNTNSVTITVNALPAAAAGSSAAVCSGNAATIGATAVAGDNYSWTSVPSGYSSTASTASVSPTKSTVYYVTESNPTTGCSNTNSVLITVNALPAAYTGASAKLCSGSPVTSIGGTSVSGNTYSWSPNTYLSSATVSNPTVTLGGTTTYTLTETITSTGCSKSNSVTLTLNTSPAANAGVSQAVCAGSSAILGSGASSGVSGSTYSWTPATGLSSATVFNPKATPSTTTSYAMTETVTATGCKTTNIVTVTVNPLPAAYIGATSATSICAGTSYSLGGTPVTGSLYSWTSNPSGFTSSIANPNASPAVATTYTLVETNASTGCSNSNSVAIGIISLPVANVSTTAICYGTNGVVVANYTTSTEVFKWYYNGSVLKNQTGFRVITGNGGAYQAYITDNSTGCSNMSNVANLVVNPLPSANVKALAATTQCQGDSIPMIAPLDSYDVYQWTNNGNPISGATAYMYSAKQSGAYQVTVTSSVTTCSNTSTAIPITVNPVPNVPFNVPGKTTICNGQDVLMNTSQQTGVTYTWYNGTTALAGTDSNYYAAKSTGNYSVQVTFDSTGCSAMSTPVSVTVLALPETNVAALGNKNLCPGASVLLVADPATGNSYRWENGSSYIAGASSDTFSASQAGSYAVTVTNSLGCSATSSPVSVTAALHPTVTINRPSATTFCQNTITLTVKDTEAASFQWWKDGAAINGATGDSLVVDQTGFYAVMVQGTVTCTAMDTIGITDNPTPVAMFSVSRDTVCFGNGINFYNQSTLSSGNMIYTWTTGDGDTSFNANISHIYAKPGSYNVNLNVAASTGCNANASQTVQVLPITKSAFNVTPEGDRRLGFKAVDTTGSTYVWNYGDSTFGTGYIGYHMYNRDGKFNITLTAINANGCVTSTTSSEVIVLSGFGQVNSENLSINIFPNPFTTQTNVQYNLNEGSMVQIDVYDMNGRAVAHVDNSMQSAGSHNYVFSGPNPGIYFVKMIVGNQQFVNRIVQQ